MFFSRFWCFCLTNKICIDSSQKTIVASGGHIAVQNILYQYIDAPDIDLILDYGLRCLANMSYADGKYLVVFSFCFVFKNNEKMRLSPIDMLSTDSSRFGGQSKRLFFWGV